MNLQIQINREKSNKNIELENYKFRVGWIKNYIKKNIGTYFKRQCDRQEEEAKTYASTLDGEIEYLMKTKKEKEEFKKNQNLIIQSINQKNI